MASRLHVDNRCLALHHNRFGYTADAQLTVDRDCAGAADRDALAFDRLEPRERERDRVGARPQIDDLILAGSVGDGRTSPFDERRAGGLDGHPG